MNGTAIVVGGGIAGLTTAASLLQTGWRVTVVEQAPTFAPVGAGILVQGNALAVLDALDLSGRIRAAGLQLSSMAVADARGRTLSSPGDERAAELWRQTFAIHRADLVDALLSACAVADLQLGARVASVDPDRVTLQDGRILQADLVVGADGIGSVVRGDAARSRYAGYTCWRAVTPNVGGWTEAMELWGRGQRVGIVPLTEGRVYSFWVDDAPEGTDADPLGTTTAELQARFAGFDGPAGVLRDGLPADARIHHADLRELDRVVMRIGAIPLVGDAAHGMTPNLGQGAAQGIEDGMALATCLAEHDAVLPAIDAYEARRLARTRAVWARSRMFGRVGQWRHPLACWIRDGLTRLTPASTMTRQLDALLAPGQQIAERFRALD